MQSEPHDWTVPVPLRALLWWPPVALVVALLEPEAAVGTIAVAGGVLAGIGALLAAIGRAVARRLAAGPAGRLETADGDERESRLTLASSSEITAPLVIGHRAA